MPGFMPAIHAFTTSPQKNVDGPDKPGHDGAKDHGVMPGPVPGIHALAACPESKAWMPATSAGMT